MILTDWICVLTAGATVDGRNVEPEVIDQIAESYDPKVYNARINIEHNPYGFKLGSVAEVKAQEVDGAKKLFAKLKPTDFFLTLIQAGQKLHTSVEFVMDFAKTGKAYLTGLALTDTPASLGTTEMHLSIQTNGESQAVQTFSTDETIDPPTPKTSFLNKLLSKEDDEMDAATTQLLSEMSKTQAQTVQALNAVSDRLEKLSVPAPATPEQKEGDPAANPEGEEQTQVFTELQNQVNELTSQVSDLTTALSKVTDEGFRPEATGANPEDKEENVVL